MQTTALEGKSSSVLVRSGKQDRSLVGWKYSAVLAHLENHFVRHEWCDIGCLARVTFHRDTSGNRTAVRQRLRNVARKLIEQRRQFLVVEYATGKHGEALRIKIYEGTTEAERQAAIAQLDRMWKRKEINAANYDTARGILGEP